jgi:hypothetical protein
VDLDELCSCEDGAIAAFIDEAGKIAMNLKCRVYFLAVA